jgi:hypothetical protein
MKYVRRKWLSSDTHSSGYIMYYYNQRCLNDACTNFVRIADCQYAFVLDFDGLPRKDIHRFFERMNSLLNLEIKSFRFKKYGFILRNYSKNHSRFCIVEYSNKRKCPKVLVNLHHDRETCNLKQWQRKLKMIKEQTQSFYNFLKINNII